MSAARAFAGARSLFPAAVCLVSMINRRLVFLFPGFEPMRAAQHRDRFVRAATRSAPFWKAGVSFEDAEPRSDKDAVFLPMEATLSSEGFATRTRLVICDWGDLILAYGERPSLVRFAKGYAALGDFLLTGTLFRYCSVSWRYALFFFFPLAVLFGAFVAALLVAKLLSPVLTQWLAGLLGTIVGIVFVVFACRRWHLLTALDDWTLAKDFCRGRNPRIVKRIEDQARLIAREASNSRADEIVLAAHSLGASLAILAVAKAMREGYEPDERFSILTVGSSLLKTALHPSAKDQRSAISELVLKHRVRWTDCQALSDVINFYKSNPATSIGIGEGRRPTVVRVHVRRLLSEPTYRRVRKDFFRLHRQFVLAVERRAPYSFHMLLLGPNPIARYAESGTVNHPPLVAADEPPAAAAGRAGR